MSSASKTAYPGAESRARSIPIRDLARSAHVSVGTIHFYVKQGLLPRPTPAGPVTSYDDEHFVKLQAITRLRRDQRMKLGAIRAWFASATPEQIVAAAGIALPALAAPTIVEPPPEPVVAPVVAPPAPAPAAPVEVVTLERLGPYRPTRALARERWERVAICPGVELHVRSDADDEAMRVAREIADAYAMKPVDAPQ